MAHFSDAYFTDRFKKSYTRLHPDVQKQCDRAIKQVLEDPTYRGLRAKPIQPSKIYWEARVGRADRLIYKPEGSTVYFIDVITHDELSAVE